MRKCWLTRWFNMTQVIYGVPLYNSEPAQESVAIPEAIADGDGGNKILQAIIKALLEKKAEIQRLTDTIAVLKDAVDRYGPEMIVDFFANDRTIDAYMQQYVDMDKEFMHLIQGLAAAGVGMHDPLPTNKPLDAFTKDNEKIVLISKIIEKKKGEKLLEEQKEKFHVHGFAHELKY